jgi:hypothetical protein
LAAGAAASRLAGDEALRLFRIAADAAVPAGDRAGAARDLATMAMFINRAPGIMATTRLPPRGDSPPTSTTRGGPDLVRRAVAPWYPALWAEAAVLDHHPDAAARVERARHAARDNPIATAILGRAAAIATGDRDALVRLAVSFAHLGCRYQQARTGRIAAAPLPVRWQIDSG